jgi:hypothetical protein
VAAHVALYAGLGAAIGMLVPSQPAAVAVTLVGFGIVEPLISAALGPLRTISLSGASDALLGLGGDDSAIAGAGILAAWLVVATATAGAALAVAYRDLR